MPDFIQRVSTVARGAQLIYGQIERKEDVEPLPAQLFSSKMANAKRITNAHQ